MPTLHWRQRLHNWLDGQAPNRVLWLLMIAILAGALSLIREQFAGLETLLFVPVCSLLLAIWCRFFLVNSLYVSNPYRPFLRQVMQLAGEWAIVLLAIPVVAHLAENALQLTRLTGHFAGYSPGVAWLLQVLKLVPTGLAVFYVLLHPVGILLSIRDAVAQLTKLNWSNQASVRQSLLAYISQRRLAELTIRQAVRRLNRTPPTTSARLPVGRFLATLWKGFLNVQFVVYLLLLMGGLFQLDQFDELFYFLLTEERGIGVFCWTMLALCLWSGMVYVCSKILLFIQPTYYEGVDPEQPEATAQTLARIDPELRLLRNTHLWLAHGPFLVLFFTLALNFTRLTATERADPAFAGKYAGILAVLSLFYGIFSSLIRRIHGHTDRAARPERRWIFALFKASTPANNYALLIDRAPYSMLFGQGLLVGLMLLFLPSATGLFLAQKIGLYAIVMCWLAGLAYMGTLVYQFNQLPRYPLLVGLVAAVLLFSRYNDNTDIRKSPDSQATTLPGNVPASPARQRPDIRAYYTRWLATRTTPADTGTLPVVVVATAGGGIRSAAWTTEALVELNRQLPGFNRHVVAISGVSGGGVGAATYAAVLAGQPGVLTGQPAAVDADSLAPRLRHVVTNDLISPTVASMLFRGGIHNFMPVPVRAIDRNRWLEDAWEQRLLIEGTISTKLVRDKLTDSFLGLWPTTATLATSALNVPALLLNGAVAETGQKVIISNLDLGNTLDRTNPFYDVADFFASSGHDVPYKTATFLCARFPFITSGGRTTGTLPNISAAPGQTDYHIIDGGYAENTGILTAVQFIKQLQRISDSLSAQPNPGVVAGIGAGRKVAYYLLFLPNHAAAEQKGSVRTFRFLAEPIKGFLNTWNRNSIGLDQLIGRTLQRDRQALSFSYTSLTLNTKAHRYPLGWYISPTAANKMAQQAATDLQVILASPQQLLTRLRSQVGSGGKAPEKLTIMPR